MQYQEDLVHGDKKIAAVYTTNHTFQVKSNLSVGLGRHFDLTFHDDNVRINY